MTSDHLTFRQITNMTNNIFHELKVFYLVTINEGSK